MAQQTKPTKAPLTVVDAEESALPPTSPGEQAYNAVDHALSQIGEESRPLVLRSHVRREKVAGDIREVNRLLDELAEKEALADRVYAAAKASIASHRADLEDELALLCNGYDHSTSARQE